MRNIISLCKCENESKCDAIYHKWRLKFTTCALFNAYELKMLLLKWKNHAIKVRTAIAFFNALRFFAMKIKVEICGVLVLDCSS